MMIVRENAEGEYSGVGRRMYEGTEREVVIQETVMSRIGVDRVLKFVGDRPHAAARSVQSAPVPTTRRHRDCA